METELEKRYSSVLNNHDYHVRGRVFRSFKGPISRSVLHERLSSRVIRFIFKRPTQLISVLMNLEPHANTNYYRRNYLKRAIHLDLQRIQF